MLENDEKLVQKSIPTYLASTSLLVPIGFTLSLYLCRKSEFFLFAFLRSMAPEYPSHLSNLSISFILYTTAGFAWIQMGVPFKYI